MKALALFSGGLDSQLAVKLIMEQGIDVIACNFVSHFFGGRSERIEKAAAAIGVELVFIDFKDAHLDMMRAPVYGFGSNMNPCIDCHALMMRYCLDMLDKYGASFVITGEVLGQRPMSQNQQAFHKIEMLIGEKYNLIVRPLSAKLLQSTFPEEKGWINRDKLLDISGRNRKVQMEYAEKYGIVDYPSPAGGCLLTDPCYSAKLKILFDDGELDKPYLFELVKNSRFFRLSKGEYCFAGRNQADNDMLKGFRDKSVVWATAGSTNGPDIVIVGGTASDFKKDFVKKVFSRYSQAKSNSPAGIIIDGEDITIPPIMFPDDEIKKYMVK